jgi:hypothetical protein
VLNISRCPGDGYLVETALGVELAEGGDDERLGRSLRLHVGPVRRHRFRVRQRANLNNNKNITNQSQCVKKQCFGTVGTHLIRVRIQYFRLNTDPDPGF